ncbi:MAG: threonine dehydratase [Alphaproteobacteria bacterium]|nr:threonine dehydratase [Alphaproteobacteria bacterium]
MTDLAALEEAASLVHEVMPPTPQYCWPLLSERCGAEVWVKHENHTPTGAFKIRGGLVYTSALKRDDPSVTGMICATRGNHGQSVATAARRFGLRAVIVVPKGNSVEKNAAMTAQGGELIEHGSDFQAALEHAQTLAAEQNLHMFPSFHDLLVRGVASYALELFQGAPELDTVYVPIGLGSGICAVIAARDALNLKTKIVGVVAANAPTYALSFSAGKSVPTNSADTMADGVACRVPVAQAVELINKGAERIVELEEAEFEAAMRHYFTDTHNVAEGAGAAGLAALLKERDRMLGRRVGVVLTGGNVDTAVYRRVLANGAD